VPGATGGGRGWRGQCAREKEGARNRGGAHSWRLKKGSRGESWAGSRAELIVHLVK
jgi:hypothetical protein